MSQVAGSFAVVVPMFNEEDGAQRCLDEISRALEEWPSRARLVAVNDGSADRTAEVLRSARQKHAGLTVVNHERNLGYGQALQTGGRAALELGCDFVIFMDSDLTNDPRFIRTLVGEDEGRLRFSEGLPLHQGRRSRERALVALLDLSRRQCRGPLALRASVHDCTNGFRAIRTELLARMRIHERSFPAIMEELYWAKLLRARVCEVPYILTSRKETLRPSSFEYRPRVFFRYLKYPFMAFFRIQPSTKQNNQ